MISIWCFSSENTFFILSSYIWWFAAFSLMTIWDIFFKRVCGEGHFEAIIHFRYYRLYCFYLCVVGALISVLCLNVVRVSYNIYLFINYSSFVRSSFVFLLLCFYFYSTLGCLQRTITFNIFKCLIVFLLCINIYTSSVLMMYFGLKKQIFYLPVLLRCSEEC